MSDLRPRRTALVTGSAGGIGFEIAAALGAQGHRIVLNDRVAESLEASATSLRARGIETVATLFDASDLSQVTAAFEQFAAEIGGVDILVNNAGVVRDRSFLRMSEREWRDVVHNNLDSVYCCTKLAVVHMVERRWGRILNVSSIVGQYGAFGQVNYAASKGGVIGFTKALAKELASLGVTVNAIAPGYITTKMTSAIPAAVLSKIKERIPTGRLGEPTEVAAVAAFLCSEEARYVTGAVVNVDGGF